MTPFTLGFVFQPLSTKATQRGIPQGWISWGCTQHFLGSAPLISDVMRPWDELITGHLSQFLCSPSPL